MDAPVMFQRKIFEIVPKDAIRRTHKYSVTDTEFSSIQSMYQQEGFDNLRDYLVYLSHQSPEASANLQNRYQQLVIRINALGTHINKIESGVDVIQAQSDLLEGVKQLCRTFKL